MESKLQEIEQQLQERPEDAKLWLAKGLELVNLNMHYEAVEAYSIGLSYAPLDQELLLARGRRYISLRRFYEAIADTVAASQLEPNSFDNWYYQGVAYCLIGNYKYAAHAMERCLAVVEAGDASLLCPVVHWLWLVYMRLGDKEAAAKVLEKVDEQTPVLAMAPSYKKMVLLYKGILDPATFIDESQLTSTDERALLYYITESYSLSNFYYLNGNTEQSNEILRRLKEIPQYHYVFAYMLAEQDMRKRGL